MRISLAIFCLMLTGCATVGVTRLNQATAKPENCPLEVFTSEKDVSREFLPVCLLDSRTGTNAFADKTMAGAIELVRPKACECGADALVVMGGRAEGMTFFSGSQGYATVKAIKYK